MHNMYLYLLIMAGVSYLVRVLPMTLIRRPIKNRFIRSFLYYFTDVTRSVMSVPALGGAPPSPQSGLSALAVGMAAAWLGADLFKTAVLCCASVLAVEFFLF